MKKAIINANIYTANRQQLWAEMLIWEKEQIIYVGKYDDTLLSSVDEVYDADGKTVIPGIIDSHTHPGWVSQSAWHIKLPWTEDVNELLAFIKDYAEKHPKEEVPFLYFEYYPTSMFGPEGPTKELLDTAVSDRPCLCQDFGEHLHWVNSKMLEAMEVTKDTPDPNPGIEEFVRDENGEPTGWIREFAWLHFADKLYKNIGWEPPISMTPDRLQAYFSFLREHGIIAIADSLQVDEAQLKSVYELDQVGELKLYYDGILRFRRYEDLPETIALIKEYQKKYTTKRIKINTLKLFLDGTNESGNSALLEPHINDPTQTNYGEIQMDTEELTKCFLLANENGLDMHIHMVGDRAFRVACDAVEAAQKEVAHQGKSWVCQPIFAHCELVDPQDMHRPAELGIIINWTPHWSGGYFGEEAKNFIAEEKWNNMYQFNPMIASGATVTFSSDVTTFYELHRAHPFFSMQVGMTRVDPEFPLNPDKYPGSVRPPESAKLSLDDLMLGYTINGAKQLRWEDRLGSLEKGKLANFNILSANPFKTDPFQLKEINFETVVFEGEVIAGSF